MGVSFGFTRLFQQCDKVGPYWVSVMVVFCIGKTHLLPHWFQFDIRKEENRKMVYTWTFHRAAVRSRLKFIFATNEMKRFHSCLFPIISHLKSRILLVSSLQILVFIINI